MKKLKKVFAGVLALSLAASMAACNDATETGGATGTNVAGETTTAAPGDETTAATTTRATVAVVSTEVLADEKTIIENAAAKLPDIELASNEIKWLASYDKNPNDQGQAAKPPLLLFQEKYNGSIKWYSTTYEARFTDLSTYVNGGEGIDFWPGDDQDNYPNGVINGQFEAVDPYIDLSDPLWDKTREAMELFKFGSQHYAFVYAVNPEYVTYYSKATIDEFGLEDPYEQWKAGEWNWDTFKASLKDYVDSENDQFGLDGFALEKALFLSAGVPMVGMKDGNLVCNINDPIVEKAMNFGTELFNEDLIVQGQPYQANGTEYPSYLGQGKQLFYLDGIYNFEMASDLWDSELEPDDVGLVPVPSPAGSPNYMSAKVESYTLLKGGANPEGVAAYVLCHLIASQMPELDAIEQRQQRSDYGWTDEFIQARSEINAAAAANPVVDFAPGSSQDINSLTYAGGNGAGIRSSYHGADWATTRSELAEVLIMLVDELNVKMQNQLA
ncbi:MAG: hypothetical protein LBM87_06525 [Ruminococcus sp.]|jgi:hypothetical protein|nr:hypothetical protein [Ruminococcus sp.]